MPFMLSPGVAVVEKDFSSIVPATSSSAGAYCGPFAWGPIEDPVRVSSETDLVARFGKPNDDNFQSFFAASNFLAYTNNLLVTRTDAANLKNAVVTKSASITQGMISVSSVGAGYVLTDAPQVVFSAPDIEGGTTATATVTYTEGAASSVTYYTMTGISGLSPGAGYTTSNLPVATVSEPNIQGGRRATVDVTYTTSGLDVTVTGVTVTQAGTGYTALPTITFNKPTVNGSTAATATVVATSAVVAGVQYLTITGITIVSPGSGYTSAPTITFSAPAIGTRAMASVINFVTAGVKIKNIDDYLSSFNGSTGSVGQFAAKFAGSKANGLRVVVLDAGNWASSPTDIKSMFSGIPGTSTYALARGWTNDEVHIVVLDTATGIFSGVPNSVLEKYTYLSKLSDSRRTDGSNNYYKSVINSQSKYIWWTDHPYDTSYSEPTSNDLINSVSGTAMAFSASTVTIPVSGLTDPVFLSLMDYKAFFDSAADKATRQITFANTVSNNNTFAVASVNSIVNLQSVPTSVTIVIKSSFVTESATAAKIYSVQNDAWGITSTTTTGSHIIKSLAQTFDVLLSGGVDDYASSQANITSAYGKLVNAEQYDISLLPMGNVSSIVARWVLDNVAEVRKDCMVFISPNDNGDPITSTGSTATDTIVAFRNETTINSSYAVMDSGFKYQYDSYNDTYRWVTLNSDIAGLCARTDAIADPWYSPGGFNRGQIKNIVKLAFNPNQADRDVLYYAGVNPVVSFPGQGVVLYGDKTMLTKPSAFDRINVRRLFIVLEKSIAIAAKYQMFEFNDSFTRAQFKNLVEPYLRDVQGRRGLTDFRVVCDESNNTSEVIDANEFVASLFLKPSRSVNFVTLNFIAARTSASFEEIGG